MRDASYLSNAIVVRTRELFSFFLKRPEMGMFMHSFLMLAFFFFSFFFFFFVYTCLN